MYSFELLIFTYTLSNLEEVNIKYIKGSVEL